MVDGSLEEDGWGSVGIVGWEGEGELEGKTSVGSVVWALYRRKPREKITVGGGEGGDARGRGGHERHQLGL